MCFISRSKVDFFIIADDKHRTGLLTLFSYCYLTRQEPERTHPMDSSFLGLTCLITVQKQHQSPCSIIVSSLSIHSTTWHLLKETPWRRHAWEQHWAPHQPLTGKYWTLLVINFPNMIHHVPFWLISLVLFKGSCSDLNSLVLLWIILFCYELLLLLWLRVCWPASRSW